MIQKVEMQGCPEGYIKWDDGSDHNDVTKIYVRGGLTGIQYIHIDYLKNGQTIFGSVQGYWDKGFTQMFELNHLKDEHLIAVDIYYTRQLNGVKALQFTTNLRVSEIMGYDHLTSDKFTLAVEGKKIIGFHGSVDGYLTTLGAYFDWIPSTKMEAKGGEGGKAWDDGSEQEAISNIQVQGGSEGIQFIKFDYIKDGHPKVGPVHDFSDKDVTFTGSFEIDYRQEYLVSVEGYYDEDTDVIQGLKFITNINTSEVIGYEEGTKFVLATHGKKIIGFHGYAEKELNSLGAYFITVPPTKLEAQGLGSGSHWDDGTFEGVKKVYIGYEKFWINYIGFDYENEGKTEKSQHGLLVCEKGEFVVDYPNEYITSVEGIYQYVSSKGWVIASLTFNTSKGRTSQTFGGVQPQDKHTKFVLKSKGCALVGFHGVSFTSTLTALGAYSCLLPPRTHTVKLEAQGGEGGVTWDDGNTFNGVRKIIVGQEEVGIAFVKIVYDKDTQKFFGDDHGNKKMLKSEEFELDYPSEYITSVEGSYEKVSGSDSEVILMLKFTTNKRTSQVFGHESTSSFILHKDKYKIVGFHGKSGNMLHKIGVHVMPISHHPH